VTDIIEAFRRSVRKLEPTGEQGFEGLMAAVLSDLTQRSFTLANSGSQRGRDGQSALDDGATFFEAKRYDDAIPKDAIYTKIFEIAADKTNRTELFVLAATCPIPAQHLTTLTDAARRFGLAVLVAGWPETGMPELAALLAMTSNVTATFLAKYTSTPEAELDGQLSAIRAHPQFQARANEIRLHLQQPSIAPAFALKDNRAWLSQVFSDKARARVAFGQVLSPGDATIPGTIERPLLRDRVADRAFGKPDDAVIAVLGADGNGKSWIFAQAWKHQTNPPLTVVIVPADIQAAPSLEYCRELLISKLLSQTGELPRSEYRERWLRHFERWQSIPTPDRPRLSVFLDGINQRERFDWPKFINAMSDIITQLGGRLVLTCRSRFYHDRLQGNLVSRTIEIDIPEWSDAELDALLRDRGTSIAALDPGIVRSLRNPRLFGVAAALFSEAQVSEFGELSVSRLLFEHIRRDAAMAGGSLSASAFAAELCTLAQRMVQRLKQQDRDSFNEFELPSVWSCAHSQQSISEQFVLSATGRFFEVVEENPNRYVLKDDGLPLALGLALVRAAQEALRKQRSIDEALSGILDPIAALDRTSDVLLGAILSAVLQELSQEIVASLVRSFVALQNLDAARYPEFRSLFARRPDAFLAALEAAVLSKEPSPNLSWLTDAANDLQGKTAYESALSSALHRWLSMYSLDPDRLVFVPNTPQHAAERLKQRTERQKKLDTAMESLSAAERALLSGMIQAKGGDYSQLSLLAFQAMADRPRALFADSLRNWCFANALNGNYGDHREDFNALLHFNVTDWAATRRSLLESAKLLRLTDTSRTGRWAIVNLLYATGDSDDAEEATRMVEELMQDRDTWQGLRSIERYCATDPCDPASLRPDNIDQTALLCEGIKVEELCRYRGHTRDDHILEMVQTGLARFRPEPAIAALRKLADQAIGREPLDFLAAVAVLDHNTVALEDRIAASYVGKAREISQAALNAGDDKHDQALVAAQSSLSVAFPHMSGDAQFEALLNHPADKTVLLDLACLFQPIDGANLEAALEKAEREGDPVSQFRIMCFAEYSHTPLTTHTIEIVLRFLGSTHAHVRLSALSLIRATANTAALTGLVENGWSAMPLDPVSQKIEIYQGSEALVLAAACGLISLEACINRIGQCSFESLADRLGLDAVKAVARRLDVSIQKAVGFQVPGNLPEMKQTRDARFYRVLIEVSERRPAEPDGSEPIGRLSDTNDAWHDRQRRNQETVDRFESDLAKADAQLIIQSVSSELIARIDAVAPGYIDSWSGLFLGLDRRALGNVHNIAAMVAEVVSRRDGSVGRALFERLATSTPPARLTFGWSHVGLDSASRWGAVDNQAIKELCYARLDGISNDHDLAMEVIAAIRAQRITILRDYVMDRRQRPEPAHRARAVMVAGFATDDSWATETIEMLQNQQGFLGSAYEAAKYAKERHRWSRHWAAKMRSANDPLELWRYAVLLSKIVDGRVEWSEISGDAPSPLINRFGATLMGPIRDRIQKWKDKRKSTLYGRKAPNVVFLRSIQA
jgi:hypothetical protein